MIIEEQLVAYLEETLAAEEREKVERELAEDAAALAQLADQRRLDRALRAALGDREAHELVKQSILAVTRATPFERLKARVLAATSVRREPAVPLAVRWRVLGWASVAAAACLAVALWVRFAAPLPDAARLASVTGEVSVIREGVKQETVAGFALRAGDQLRVARKSSVSLVYADATRLEFDEGSQAAFSGKPEDGKQFELALGRVVARVSKQPPGKPLRIRTPHATAMVVGTEFDLRVSTRGTRLDVSEGLVQLAYIGGGRPMMVAAGDFVEIAPGAKTTVPYGDQPRDPNAVFSPSDVATLTRIAGGVSVLRHGEPQAVADGFAAQPGDLLRVGGRSAATVVYPDQSRLELWADTRLSFHAGPHEGKQLGFELGTMIGRVSKQPPGKPLRIRTPHAIVTVAEAGFDLRVSTRGTRLDVIESSAQISWDGEEHSTVIEAGEFIELALLPDGTLTIHRRGSTAEPPPAPISGGARQ